MKSNDYTVYAHKNKTNGKVYVGITSQSVKDRWKNGSGYHGMHFERAIQKYGWDGFDHIIIESNLNEYQACELEKALIKIFDLTNPQKGYNEAIGGFGGGMNGKHHTKEAIEKIREARIRDGFSYEHRKHISESKQGAKHHMAKKVYQYTKDGTLVKEWDYMGMACKELNIQKTNVSQCCLGKRPSAGGYVWSYKRKE